MSVPGGQMIFNPVLNGLFSMGIFGSGQFAANSQAIGQLVNISSGQPLPTVFYPNSNPWSFNTQAQSLFSAPFNPNQSVFNANSFFGGTGTTSFGSLFPNTTTNSGVNGLI